MELKSNYELFCHANAFEYGCKMAAILIKWLKIGPMDLPECCLHVWKYPGINPFKTRDIKFAQYVMSMYLILSIMV